MITSEWRKSFGSSAGRWWPDCRPGHRPAGNSGLSIGPTTSLYPAWYVKNVITVAQQHLAINNQRVVLTGQFHCGWIRSVDPRIGCVCRNGPIGSGPRRWSPNRCSWIRQILSQCLRDVKVKNRRKRFIFLTWDFYLDKDKSVRHVLFQLVKGLNVHGMLFFPSTWKRIGSAGSF